MDREREGVQGVACTPSLIAYVLISSEADLPDEEVYVVCNIRGALAKPDVQSQQLLCQ